MHCRYRVDQLDCSKKGGVVGPIWMPTVQNPSASFLRGTSRRDARPCRGNNELKIINRLFDCLLGCLESWAPRSRVRENGEQGMLRAILLAIIKFIASPAKLKERTTNEMIPFMFMNMGFTCGDIFYVCTISASQVFSEDDSDVTLTTLSQRNSNKSAEPRLVVDQTKVCHTIYFLVSNVDFCIGQTLSGRGASLSDIPSAHAHCGRSLNSTPHTFDRATFGIRSITAKEIYL